jgi:Ca-activated chloride channel family protein
MGGGGGGMMGGGGGGRGGMVDEMLGENVDQSGRSYYKQVWSRYRPGATRHKRPSSEQYHPIHENEFIAAVGGKAISTFSIDVDTAAYANMRRFINSGQMPPADSIRIEELVNYFQYDYPQPTGDDPFSVNMELATCPWNESHKLLRVGLKGKEVHVDERPATNLVFLIDVSGSMSGHDKLPLLKRGFQMMVNKLSENDRVSIVTYAGNAGVALEPTSGDQTKVINDAIEVLKPGGSTHGSAGIELAYKLAQQNFIHDGVNKVILATDGDLNVGVTDDNSLVKLIKQKASEDVFLTVLGFGTGNLKDGKMEQLADNGNGMYAYIDNTREAHKVLVDEMSGSLVTIAKDVKIQIEFNPAEVKSYRLIGYENRILATQDFDNDKKDAGEIGAGHTVTAIYEIATIDSTGVTNVPPAGMKYQSGKPASPKDDAGKKGAPALSEAAGSGELLTLALRYKQPTDTVSKKIEFTIKNDEKSFLSASDDFRFAASSKHAGTSNPGSIQDFATGAIGKDRSGFRAEFIDLVRKVGGIH